MLDGRDLSPPVARAAPRRAPVFYGWVLVATAFVTMGIVVNSRTAFSLFFPSILGEFGWETEDVGGAPGARALEPLCQLWCAPGFLRNDWSHAFKVVR